MNEQAATPVPGRHSSPWYFKDGVVYFIAAGAPPKAIKIGVSTYDALAERLRSIQGGNHERVELIGAIRFEKPKYDQPMKDAEALERELHSKFAQHCRTIRLLPGHEWFDPSEALIEYIAAGRTEQRIVSLEEHAFTSAEKTEVAQHETMLREKGYRLIWRPAGEKPGPMEFTKLADRKLRKTTLTWLDWPTGQA